jgi:hypothetical protein
MPLMEIKNRWTGAVIYSGEAATIAELVINAVRDNINLNEAQLTDVVFPYRASLDRARLDGASLSGARLDGASLSGASLDGASLSGASLDGASLSGASLSGASLVGASLARASLDGANLDGASLVGARLDRASLDRARLNGASLDRARLDGASLVGALIGKHVCAGPYMQLTGVCEWGPMVAYIAKDSGLRIIVGCRHFSIAEAKAHWKTKENRRMTRWAIIAAESWARRVQAK